VNSVSFMDGKKFYNLKSDYQRMREVSDRLCREHKLSVIRDPQGKGKNYAQWSAEKNGKGKTRLSSMLRSEKPLKVFAVKDDELQVFCREAKKYGVLYCVLKDKDATDGLTDIMVKADDGSKINRIFERFNLSHVDVGQVKSEIERQMQEQQQKKKPGDIPVPEAVPSEDKEDAFIDRLLAKPPNAEKQQNENPTDGRIAKSRQSVPTSVTKEGIARGDAEPRPSVRQELKQIREDQAQTASKSSRKKNPRAPQHHNHNHSRKRHKKTKER